ncbi:hypothetical protein TNIN_179481 [Trichonephila inaurata madagascariensis]|uniref:Uncharacterized protein n=1 Tax=Trichonephila inaurata madagascariensis TaxID=2747483 RepID=A0A8X7CCY5_9ARAC|nr:hypothetical protein TNIN_179481 [Trichonephila inaurata madagascariensis]
MDPERWYQRLWKSITSRFRVGEKETFTQPSSDKSIQDSLSNHPFSILSIRERPHSTLIFLQHPPKNRTLYEHYWNGELLSSGIPVKDSIDPAKEEPENDLGTESENHCLCKENCDLRNHAIGVCIKDKPYCPITSCILKNVNCK